MLKKHVQICYPNNSFATFSLTFGGRYLASSHLIAWSFRISRQSIAVSAAFQIHLGKTQKNNTPKEKKKHTFAIEIIIAMWMQEKQNPRIFVYDPNNFLLILQYVYTISKTHFDSFSCRDWIQMAMIVRLFAHLECDIKVDVQIWIGWTRRLGNRHVQHQHYKIIYEPVISLDAVYLAVRP